MVLGHRFLLRRSSVHCVRSGVSSGEKADEPLTSPSASMLGNTAGRGVLHINGESEHVFQNSFLTIDLKSCHSIFESWMDYNDLTPRFCYTMNAIKSAIKHPLRFSSFSVGRERIGKRKNQSLQTQFFIYNYKLCTLYILCFFMIHEYWSVN